MSNKKLMTLAIAAIVMVAIAVIQTGVTDKKPASQAGITYLVQGLNIDTVESIIVGAGEERVVLSRKGETFVVSSRDDYPAKVSAMNDLIGNCFDIKTSTDDIITENPANHSDLGVTQEEAKYVVNFFDGQGQVITGILISDSNPDNGGAHVRLANEDRVYFVADAPWLRSGAMDYIDKEMLNVESGKVKSVTVTGPDENYTLKKETEGGEVVFENLPDGKKLKKTDADQVFGSLSGLRFTDVQKTGKNAELKFDTTFVCELNDTTVYRFKIAQKDDKYYVTCGADFMDQTPVTMDKGVVESEEQLKVKEAKLLARESSEEFARKHSGWVYEISSYQAEKMVKKVTDLLEDVEEEKPEPEAVEAEPAQEAEQPDVE